MCLAGKLGQRPARDSSCLLGIWFAFARRSTYPDVVGSRETAAGSGIVLNDGQKMACEVRMREKFRAIGYVPF